MQHRKQTFKLMGRDATVSPNSGQKHACNASQRSTRRFSGICIGGAAGLLALLPFAQSLMPSSMPSSKFFAGTRVAGIARKELVTRYRDPFFSRIVLSAVAPKDDANKNQQKGSDKRRQCLTRPAQTTETSSADAPSSTEEVLVGRWELAGTAKPRRKDALEKDEWLEWLTYGFPRMLATISALTDHRASTRKAAVGEILKCAADHPAGPKSAWAVAALAGRLEDDSGKGLMLQLCPKLHSGCCTIEITLNISAWDHIWTHMHLCLSLCKNSHHKTL
jgi:hypothetical protein